MKKNLLQTILAFALFVLTGQSNAQTLFLENFSSGTLPSGWTNDSLGQASSNLWVFNNPYSRVITGAGFDASYAIFDSDEGSINDNIDELASLTTPDVNISTASSSLYLELDQQYRALFGPNTTGSSYRIEFSVDAGVSWTTLAYDSMDVGYPNPAVHSTYDISSLIGNNTLRVRFTWTGTWDWWWAIDNVKIASFQPCVAAPDAGTTVASSPSVCPGINVNLSLSGADTSPLFTYQWFESTDGVAWNAILDGTGPAYTYNILSEEYFYCEVSCATFTGSSTPVHVMTNPVSLCPCIADHGGFSCTGDYISNVTISGTAFNNSSACDEITSIAYSYYGISVSTTATLVSGTSYDFSVTTSSDNIISIWIDFDQSGTFEPSEWMQVVTTSTPGNPNTINWIIPTGITSGPALMRVRSRATGSTNDANSGCLSFASGETEDYIMSLDDNVYISSLSNGVIRIFPNPAADYVSIFFNQTVTKASIVLFDELGKAVHAEVVENVFSKRLNTSALPAGIYFLRIENGKDSFTQKIILSK